jgi:FkbM family methyltransferase
MSVHPPHQAELHGSSHVSHWVRKAIYHVGPLRRVVKSRLGTNLTYTLRASRLVKRPLRFAVRSLSSRGLEPLVLRDSGRIIHVRRRSGDLVMLHQIVGRNVYRLPDEVRDRLHRVGRPIRAADLGANIGFFTMKLLEDFADAQVLAVEADPQNASVFARTLGANGLQSQVQLAQAAASDRPGTVEFAAGDYFLSRVVEGDELPNAIKVPKIDVLPLLAGRDLLKIDIEGSEWPILRDVRFKDLEAVALTLEWHSRGCPGADPRSAAEEALTDAGFTVRHQHSEGDCGTLWAWR